MSTTYVETTGLRARKPAASVIASFLNAQAGAPHRSLPARIFGASPLTDESHRYYLDALGALRVADELEKLGPDWVVLHSVAVGEHRHVIDHLVIGPSGVFAIDVVRGEGGEVSLRGDCLTVNGIERPQLEGSRDEASDAAVHLTRAAGINVPVRGLLVFVAPRSVSVHDEPYDVGVTSDRTLHARLADAPRVLDADQIEAITDAATDPETWRGATAKLSATWFDPAVFDALRGEVQRAWLARGVWSCAIVAAGAEFALRFLGH